MKPDTRYVALLRGINVGGHHKVPMAGLKKELEHLGYEDIVTLLNSGNIIFTARPGARPGQMDKLENTLEKHLEKVYGFPVPVMIREAGFILELIRKNPFDSINVTKSTRLYISFLKNAPDRVPTLPWVSEDGSYRILEVRDKTICSVLDLDATQTPKGMDALEQLFGKNITTRNWNTIMRIAEKLKS